MPYIPSDDEDDREYLRLETQDLKMVSDYTHMSFSECMRIDCYTFKKLCKDAFTHRMSETKEGREYLRDAYLLLQTEPDRESLRDVFGGDGD